ncbi:hypothetical protein BC940DRAFT_351059 [Gongronella butleri]|nr:hypothetical protein BC940DRAFT_351059 [Gongronella butleri]
MLAKNRHFCCLCALQTLPLQQADAEHVPVSMSSSHDDAQAISDEDDAQVISDEDDVQLIGDDDDANDNDDNDDAEQTIDDARRRSRPIKPLTNSTTTQCNYSWMTTCCMTNHLRPDPRTAVHNALLHGRQDIDLRDVRIEQHGHYSITTNNFGMAVVQVLLYGLLRPRRAR